MCPEKNHPKSIFESIEIATVVLKLSNFLLCLSFCSLSPPLVPAKWWWPRKIVVCTITYNDNDSSIARSQLRQLIKIKQKTFLEFVCSHAMWLMKSVREWIKNCDDATKSNWIITTNMLRILITRFRSSREYLNFSTIQKILLTREQLSRKSAALSAR